RLKRAVMCRAVDPPSEAGDDDEVLLAKVVSKAAREAACSGRGVASAHDRDRLPVEQVQIASGDEQRWRILGLHEQAWIEPLPGREIMTTKLLNPGDLSFGIAAAEQARHLAAAAPRQVRNRRKRRRGRPEADDQLAIGNRPD